MAVPAVRRAWPTAVEWIEAGQPLVELRGVDD
jgi:hypothetical protein